MAGRKAEQRVRSGRFKTETTYTIVVGASSSVYRVYNSGDDPIKVALEGVTGSLVDVKPGSSVDIAVGGTSRNITVATDGVANHKAIGAFDLVKAGEVVRNGRFESAADTVKIVGGQGNKGKGLYRLINTGKNGITVSGVKTTPAAGNPVDIPVREGCSMDFSVDVPITVSGANIKGIYTRLYEAGDSHSGHFKSTGITVLEILAITEPVPGDGNHRYRVTNSGKKPLILNQSTDGTTWTPLAANIAASTVDQHQSRDFQVGSAAPFYLGVVATDAAHEFSGILDYLGPS